MKLTNLIARLGLKNKAPEAPDLPIEGLRRLWQDIQERTGGTTTCRPEDELLPARSPDLALQRATLDDEIAHRDRGEIERLLDSLELHPVQRQLMLVRGVRGYRMAQVVRALCQKSWAALGADTDRARNLALLAIELAGRLERRRYPEGFVEDLKGLAWVRLGHAERRASNLVASESAFLRAEAALQKGSGDFLELAALLHSRGMLRMDQGRLEEAFTLTERAARLYEEMGNWNSVARATVDQGEILAEMGKFEEACRKVIAASFLVDKGSEPRLVLAILHNLALYLSGLGKVRAALSVLEEAKPLYEAVGKRAEILRRLWLEGNLLKKLGWPSWREAVARFREAREGFLAQGWVLEAARLSLEEALISDPEGRREVIRELLTEMLPVLRLRGLHQEALSAIALLEDEVCGRIGAATIEAAIHTLKEVRLGTRS